ncbi:MAG: glycosyltransferase [Brevinema sp.]
MAKKRVVIAYTNTGSGHKTPAEAVALALEEKYPGKYDIILSDFFADAGQISFNKMICDAWDWLLARPRLNFFNILLTSMLAPSMHKFLPTFYRKAWEGGMEYLKKLNPDVVFTTHFYCQNVAVDARKRYNLHYPVITLNPDSFETFALWDKRGDLFMVNSDQARNRALHWGHHPNRTIIVPQALRKSFDPSQIPSKAFARKQLELADYFTLFLSDGGQGIGIMLPVVKKLIASGETLNAICICGRNEKLYNELSALKSHGGAVHLSVYRYTDQIATLLAASDVFVGKGGPASVIEASKMGLPVVITYMVNTAETHTKDFFLQKGLGWYCKKPSQAITVINRFKNNPELYNQVVKHIKDAKEFSANGSPIIAEAISQAVENPEYLTPNFK